MKLGIISDIHEDLIRLKESFSILDKHGCNEVACLGDIAGFSIPSFGYMDTRDASACLELVKNNCSYIVAGNHDLFPAEKIPVQKAGFHYPDNWYELDYIDRKKLAADQVWLNEEVELNTLFSSEEKSYISTLPEYLVMDCGGVHLLLSHYLYPDLTGSTRKYYKEFGPVDDHLDFIEQNNCLLGISGHQHVEGVCQINRIEKKFMGFGDVRLRDELQWLVGPCVANGKWRNGCMVLDTNHLKLSVIALNTTPRVMVSMEYKKI